MRNQNGEHREEGNSCNQKNNKNNKFGNNEHQLDQTIMKRIQSNHKLLPFDFFKEYNRLKLPYPPEDVFTDFGIEMYMAINLLRANPKYFVNNFMELIRNGQEDEIQDKNYTLKDADKIMKKIAKLK